MSRRFLRYLPEISDGIISARGLSDRSTKTGRNPGTQHTAETQMGTPNADQVQRRAKLSARAEMSIIIWEIRWKLSCNGQPIFCQP